MSEIRPEEAPARWMHQLDDPYGWYDELRAGRPVRQIDDDVWIAVGYDAVVTALHEPVLFSSAQGMGGLLTGRVGPKRVDSLVLRGFTHLPVHATAK